MSLKFEPSSEPLLSSAKHLFLNREQIVQVSRQSVGRGGGLRIDPPERHHASKRCSRDTYPESYITKYTSIRSLRIRVSHARVLEGEIAFGSVCVDAD